MHKTFFKTGQRVMSDAKKLIIMLLVIMIGTATVSYMSGFMFAVDRAGKCEPAVQQFSSMTDCPEPTVITKVATTTNEVIKYVPYEVELMPDCPLCQELNDFDEEREQYNYLINKCEQDKKELQNAFDICIKQQL